jgi:hypothetical protein
MFWDYGGKAKAAAGVAFAIELFDPVAHHNASVR